MRKFALVGLLLLFSLSAHAELKPVHLRSEYPRLTWQVTSKERNQRQTAYHLLIASSREQLASGKGDLLDSGTVKTNTTAVSLAMRWEPTATGEIWWKVRVWDKDGKASGWSSPAMFEDNSALEAALAQAKWIGRTEDKTQTPAPLFRKTFEIGEKITSAKIAICGLGYHELRINGKKVGDHVLDPGYTRYDRRMLYVTHDVTKLLNSGKNALGVMLGNGFFNVTTKNAWDFDKAPWRAAPRVSLVLTIQTAKQRTVIATDESWKTQTGAIVYDNIYGGETYDARLEKLGWDTPDYNDSGWDAAKIVTSPGGKLTAQTLPPIRVVRTLKPAKITEPKPGVFVFDMGENTTGWAQLLVTGAAGTKVQLRFAERLNKDGTLDNMQIAEHTGRRDPGGRFQTEEYLCKGMGSPEVYEPRFTYHGFQYVEVTGYPGKPTLESLRGRIAHTDFESTGEFTCSNELLNKIQAATRRSFLSNFFSIPTDCPHREKNGWTGDAHLAAEQALFNFDTASAYRKWIQDLADEQKPTGELPGIVPSSGWGYDWGNGPAWDSAFLLIPLYLHHDTGDITLLEKHYAQMKRYVDYLTSKAENGIVSIGLGDWVPYQTETPVNVTSTAYYYRDAQIVAEAARLLGNTDDAARYSVLANSIKQAFNAKFYNNATGLYSNGSQTALSCALYQGLTTPENRVIVLRNLVNAIEKRNFHIDTGILGAKYVLNALLENGREDVAYRIVTQKDLPSWGWWIEQGATTLWEDWKGENSRNHIMFGDISAWFYKALAGIRTDLSTPGFSHIVIRPFVPNNLPFARALYDSVRGKIVSEWKIEKGLLTLTVTLPANTTGEIHVPVQGDNAVTVSEGTTFKERTGGYAVYMVGSGTYTLTTKHN